MKFLKIDSYDFTNGRGEPILIKLDNVTYIESALSRAPYNAPDIDKRSYNIAENFPVSVVHFVGGGEKMVYSSVFSLHYA